MTLKYVLVNNPAAYLCISHTKRIGLYRVSTVRDDRENIGWIKPGCEGGSSLDVRVDQAWM